VDVRDVVQGSIQAEQTAPSGERYILSGHWHSLQDIAQITAKHAGVAAPKLVVPIWLAEIFQPVMAKLAQISDTQPLYTKSMLGAMHSNHQISHAKATRDLGYAPRPFYETLKDTLDWFRQHKDNPA
jgi:dihydroflavonol-4-reductase